MFGKKNKDNEKDKFINEANHFIKDIEIHINKYMKEQEDLRKSFHRLSISDCSISENIKYFVAKPIELKPERIQYTIPISPESISMLFYDRKDYIFYGKLFCDKILRQINNSIKKAMEKSQNIIIGEKYNGEIQIFIDFDSFSEETESYNLIFCIFFDVKNYEVKGE
jgi:hypothetical protein